MPNIIVGLIVSWVILKMLAKTNLRALAQGSVRYNLKMLGLGLAFAVPVCVLHMFWKIYVHQESLQVNPELNMGVVLATSWWTITSVIFQELIFRGALLVVAIRWFGPRLAIFICGVCFGVYHWDLYGVLGNPIAMVYVLLLTGSMGVVWAYAFALSRGLVLPIALHLGWNFTLFIVFSGGPVGPQILIAEGSVQPEGTLHIIDLLVKLIVLPVLTLVFLRFGKKRSLFLDSDAKQE